MRQTIKETVTPVDIVSVLTTGVIESHLRVTYSADSSYLDGLAKAALAAVEKEVNETFGAIAVSGDNSEYVNEFTLPYEASRIRGTVAVNYYNETDANMPIDTANITKSVQGYPTVVQINPDFKPTGITKKRPYHQIFSFSVSAKPLPEGLKQAVLMMMAHFYENREAVLSGRVVEPPLAFRFLCAQYKRPALRQPYNPEFIVR